MNNSPVDSLPLTSIDNPINETAVNGFTSSEAVTTAVSDSDFLRVVGTGSPSEYELLQTISTNTKQSADCLTTVVAFLSVFLIYTLGKWLYNIFKSFF